MSYEPSGGDSVAAPESHTSRTGLSTDSPTFFSDCPAFGAGTTVRLSYCTHVLRRLRSKKHGTPATSVAGVYSFMDPQTCPCEGRGPDSPCSCRGFKVASDRDRSSRGSSPRFSLSFQMRFHFFI